jgi:hypothetical protein
MDILKGASLAFILCIGPCHAAEKIALICSDAKGKDDYSLSIDLDRKLASFHMSELPDADDVPVTRVTENYIWFQNKAAAGIYSQGKLDRLTGSLHFFHRQLNNAKDYYLRCKPEKPFGDTAPPVHSAATEPTKKQGVPGHGTPCRNLHGLADNSAKRYARLATVDRR